MAIAGIKPIEETEEKSSGSNRYLKLASGESVRGFFITDADGNNFVTEKMHKFTPRKLPPNVTQKSYAYIRTTPCWNTEDCPLCELQKRGLSDFAKIQRRTATLFYIPSPDDAEDIRIKIIELWSGYFKPLIEIYKNALDEYLNEIADDDFDIAQKITKIIDSCNGDVNEKSIKVFKKILADNENRKIHLINLINPLSEIQFKIKRTGEGINSIYTFTPSTKRYSKIHKETEAYIDDNPNELFSIKDTHFIKQSIEEIENIYGENLPLLKGSAASFDDDDDDFDDKPKKHSKLKRDKKKSDPTDPFDDNDLDGMISDEF